MPRTLWIDIVVDPKKKTLELRTVEASPTHRSQANNETVTLTFTHPLSEHLPPAADQGTGRASGPAGGNPVARKPLHSCRAMGTGCRRPPVLTGAATVPAIGSRGRCGALRDGARAHGFS